MPHNFVAWSLKKNAIIFNKNYNWLIINTHFLKKNDIFSIFIFGILSKILLFWTFLKRYNFSFNPNPNPKAKFTYPSAFPPPPLLAATLLAFDSKLLRITSQRLGAAAACTAVYAGDKRSISHCLFCGATAAVAPNRILAAVFLSSKLPHIIFIPI